jgi:small subunit ribosomal protein S6e
MTDIKLVIGNTKTGKSVQKVITEDTGFGSLIGMKIGQKFNGDLVGLAGYEFEITGGSDYAGFPMRTDVDGITRKRIFSTRGMGVHIEGHGKKIKKTVAGNTIHAKTAQINVKILKEGKEPLEAAKKEEKKE